MADEEPLVVRAMTRHLGNSPRLGANPDLAGIIARWWYHLVYVARSTLNRYLSLDGLGSVRQAIIFKIRPVRGECVGWLMWACGSWGSSSSGWRLVQKTSPLRKVLEGRFMPSYNATRMSQVSQGTRVPWLFGPIGNVLQDTGEPDGSWFPIHTPLQQFGRMFRYSDAAGRGPKQWQSIVRNLNPNRPNRGYQVEALELNQLYKPGN